MCWREEEQGILNGSPSEVNTSRWRSMLVSWYVAGAFTSLFSASCCRLNSSLRPCLLLIISLRWILCKSLISWVFHVVCYGANCSFAFSKVVYVLKAQWVYTVKTFLSPLIKLGSNMISCTWQRNLPAHLHLSGLIDTCPWKDFSNLWYDALKNCCRWSIIYVFTHRLGPSRVTWESRVK